MNGKITSVPRKGISFYKLVWDTSSLPLLFIDESKLRCVVSREDEDMVSSLKRARLLFDEVYPDGPTTGVLMLEKPRAKKKDRHKSPVDSQQSTLMTTDSSLEGPALMNRRLTNLKMAPVLGHSNTNYSHSTSGEQQHDEYESEDERFGEDMLVDNDCEELDNIHRLYRYLPDEGYNPTSMEEDGN